MEGHSNNKIISLCFEESCTFKRASCRKCAKNHIKHLDKLMQIDDVEEFIRNDTYCSSPSEIMIQLLKKIKQAIFNELNELENIIVKKCSLDSAFFELKEKINSE